MFPCNQTFSAMDGFIYLFASDFGSSVLKDSHVHSLFRNQAELDFFPLVFMFVFS